MGRRDGEGLGTVFLWAAGIALGANWMGSNLGAPLSWVASVAFAVAAIVLIFVGATLVNSLWKEIRMRPLRGIAGEVYDDAYDPEETIRRLRDLDAKGIGVPSLVYALLRIRSSRASQSGGQDR